MKILIIGVFAFFSWSTLSTYLYVCKIKGLCNETIAVHTSEARAVDGITIDTLQNSELKDQLAIPKDLIIYFAFDKSEFSSNDNAEKYFDESKNFLSQNKQAVLRIIGHADAVGTKEYNQSLGYRRAQSMQHYFETKGLSADKIIIESMGENEPVDNNTTKAGRANNRRTELTIKK